MKRRLESPFGPYSRKTARDIHPDLNEYYVKLSANHLSAANIGSGALPTCVYRPSVYPPHGPLNWKESKEVDGILDENTRGKFTLPYTIECSRGEDCLSAGRPAALDELLQSDYGLLCLKCYIKHAEDNMAFHLEPHNVGIMIMGLRDSLQGAFCNLRALWRYHQLIIEQFHEVDRTLKDTIKENERLAEKLADLRQERRKADNYYMVKRQKNQAAITSLSNQLAGSLMNETMYYFSNKALLENHFEAEISKVTFEPVILAAYLMPYMGSSGFSFVTVCSKIIYGYIGYQMKHDITNNIYH